MFAAIFLLSDEDQWRSDQPVRRNCIGFSQNFSLLIGILVRQRSRVQKDNRVLLADSDEILLLLKMT